MGKKRTEILITLDTSEEDLENPDTQPGVDLLEIMSNMTGKSKEEITALLRASWTAIFKGLKENNGVYVVDNGEEEIVFRLIEEN